jgi:HK97 gp10 family phage protein
VPTGYDLRLDASAIEDLGFTDEAEELAQEAGDEVAERAAELAPKRTGAGAASIHAEAGRDEDGVYADVSWTPERFYMYFQEIGTERVTAQPFLRPALEQTSI